MPLSLGLHGMNRLTMTGSDAKVKMVVAGEPEEKTPMTSSSSSSSRSVSWLHLCIIYGLLGIYGLWAATSYQLVRSSLLDELDASLERRSQTAAEGLRLGEGAQRRGLQAVDTAAVRRRRSADVLPGMLQAGAQDLPAVLSRGARDARSARRRTNRRRQPRYREQNRRKLVSPNTRRHPRK